MYILSTRVELFSPKESTIQCHVITYYVEAYPHYRELFMPYWNMINLDIMRYPHTLRYPGWDAGFPCKVFGTMAGINFKDSH